MFLRFVTERRTDHGSRREGFFQALYAARRDPETPGFVLDQLDEIRIWFDANLDEPARFNRGPARHRRHATPTALSWFRTDATAHLERAFALCAILRELGYPITVLKTDRPGFIVYEDAVQVVAEPFSDTPT